MFPQVPPPAMLCAKHRPYRGNDEERRECKALEAEGRHRVEGAQEQPQGVQGCDESPKVGRYNAHAPKAQPRTEQGRQRRRQLARGHRQERLVHSANGKGTGHMENSEWRREQ